MEQIPEEDETQDVQVTPEPTLDPRLVSTSSFRVLPCLQSDTRIDQRCHASWLLGGPIQCYLGPLPQPSTQCTASIPNSHHVSAHAE